MSWQRSYWFRVPLITQLKRDNAGHGEVAINNAATVDTGDIESIDGSMYVNIPGQVHFLVNKCSNVRSQISVLMASVPLVFNATRKHSKVQYVIILRMALWCTEGNTLITQFQND